MTEDRKQLLKTGSHQVMAKLIDEIDRLSAEEKKAVFADLCDEKRHIRITPSMLSSWLKKPDTNPLYRVAMILEVSQDITPLQWLCGRIGCVFLPDASDYCEVDLESQLLHTHTMTPQVWHWIKNSARFAQLRLEIEPLTEKGGYREDRFAQVLMLWLSAKSWMEGYLSCATSTPALKPGVSPPSPVTQLLPCYQVIQRTLDSAQPNGEPWSFNLRMEIAAHVGLSPSSVTKWGQNPELRNVANTNKVKAGSATPFDILDKLCAATGSVDPVAWLCTRFGGDLSAVRSLRPAQTLPWPKIYFEMTEMEYAVTRALTDSSMNAAEANKVMEEWDDVRSWFAAFVGEAARASS